MNGLLAKTGLAETVGILLGVSLLMISGWCCHSVITRWEWFRRRFPLFSHWGRGFLTFPASRIGMLYITLTCMLIGLLMIGSLMELSIPVEWQWYLEAGITCWFLLCPVIALCDFLFYRADKDE